MHDTGHAPIDLTVIANVAATAVPDSAICQDEVREAGSEGRGSDPHRAGNKKGNKA